MVFFSTFPSNLNRPEGYIDRSIVLKYCMCYTVPTEKYESNETKTTTTSQVPYLYRSRGGQVAVSVVLWHKRRALLTVPCKNIYKCTTSVLSKELQYDLLPLRLERGLAFLVPGFVKPPPPPPPLAPRPPPAVSCTPSHQAHGSAQCQYPIQYSWQIILVTTNESPQQVKHISRGFACVPLSHRLENRIGKEPPRQESCFIDGARSFA